MHGVLLGLALGAAVAAPASSATFGAAAFSASSAFGGATSHVQAGASGVRIHRLVGVPPGADRDLRRHAHGRFAYGYLPDYYDAGYEIDRSWDSDSFNDWWHDRPDRAYPRWVWHNQGCSDDRMWWSGAGWRCTP